MWTDECVRRYVDQVLAYFHAYAVIGDDFEFFDIVVGLACHHGVDTAGIVSDHAAERAAVMGCGIGSEGEVVLFGGVAKVIEHHAGLHASDAASGIDLENTCHVLGEIQHDSDIAALPGERCAATAAEQGRTEFAASRNCGEDVVGIVRKNYADRNLTVVGAVGRVERAATVVKANVATDLKAQ